ncbi:Gamma-aminobutyric acid receptor subunit beta [Blattella germanica]|nr:Gamma-aminobutyric acid receptor subunit beta [Blattella germanica]
MMFYVLLLLKQIPLSYVNLDFTLDFYFRQFWTDPRLAFRKRPGVETLSVGSEFIKNIWVPDTFFVNEKQSYFHIATTSNEFIRIHHSGSITRSIRWKISYVFFKLVNSTSTDTDVCCKQLRRRAVNERQRE